MKKLTALFVLSLAFALTFTSCNTRNKGPVVEYRDFHYAEAYFYGDPHRLEVNYYDLHLFEKNVASGGDGMYIYLQMTTNETSVNEIPGSTYLINKRNQIIKNTFEAGEWRSDESGKYIIGSYLEIYQGNNVYSYPLSDGELKVANRNGFYTVLGTVIAEGKQYDVSFDGPIDFFDMVEPLPETLTHGEVWYYGNTPNNAAKIFTIRLGADDVNIDSFSGTGDAMQIELYAPMSAEYVIPDGIYQVEIDKVKPFTAIDGYYDQDQNFDFGTWYYTSDALDINEGYVEVEYLAGTRYKLNFSFKDSWYGYRIIGSFNSIDLKFSIKDDSPFTGRSTVRGLERVSPKVAENSSLRRGVIRSADVGKRPELKGLRAIKQSRQAVRNVVK